jgi:hypothetical protein
MPIFLNTKGRARIAIGICDRCKQKFPIGDLRPDANSPGLKVCKKDWDSLDPYRLPPRQPENIVLEFARPDVDISVEPMPECPIEILATEIDQGITSEEEAALVANDITAEIACQDEHLGFYYGLMASGFDIEVSVLVEGASVLLSWPLDPGFEVDHFEIYSVYDVAAPTSESFSLLTTLAASLSGYTDNTGYTSSFGYIVVAVGTGGQRSSSPAFFGAMPPVAPPVGITGTINADMDQDPLPPFFDAIGLFGDGVNPPTYIVGVLNSNTTGQVIANLYVQKLGGFPDQVVIEIYSVGVMLQTDFTSLDVGGLETVLSANATSFTSDDQGGYFLTQWMIPVTIGVFNAGTYNFVFA